jgi:succinate dehydrogenase / fumarate reductase flavoprotein subunit
LDAAAAYAREHDWADIPEADVAREVERALRPLERDGGENPYHLHRELQGIMTQYAGIVRMGERLTEGLNQLLALRERAERMAAPGGRRYNPGWHMCFDVESMLVLGEAIFRSALLREESRGAHHRLDCPGERPELGSVNMVARWTPEGIVVKPEPATPISADLLPLLPGVEKSRAVAVEEGSAR